jgi:hypothetical protein
MGMLDGKYWVVFGGELLGVTDDESRVEDLLKDAYVKEYNLSPEQRKRLGTKTKFDQIRLTERGMTVADFYAVNAAEL